MKTLTLILLLAFAATQSYSQCACCAGAGTGSSNGDYNNGILTLPKHTVVAEAYADYRTIKDGDAPEDDEKLLTGMAVTSVGLRYGLAKRVTVSALLPYVFLYTNSGSDQGVGDLVLLSTFSVLSTKGFNIAIQAGAELPTGIQKSSRFDNSTVVIGSGSTDPMAGVAFWKRWDKLTLQGNGLYKWTTRGFNDNYYGNVSNHSVSLSYHIKGDENFCSLDSVAKPQSAKLGVSVFAGYSGEWIDKIEEDKEVDPSSGYYACFATVGTGISLRKWYFPLTVSIPVISKMNGAQNDVGYRVRMGVIRAF